MLDLNTPGVATKIADKIKAEIDLYAQKTYDSGFARRLGPSQIGSECKRRLWYGFRWATREKFDGRQLRLFNRGHREEDRFSEFLKGIGAKLWTHDETKPLRYGKPQQYRFSSLEDHFAGNMDGVVELPESYEVEGPLLAEFKTNGTGAGFQKLFKDKLAVAKPDHYAQACIYGKKFGFTHVLYMNVCKNDDDMYVEIAKLDYRLADTLEARANDIIHAKVPPLRISDNPTFWQCKMCAMSSICHAGSPPAINCRSCKFAKPVDNGEWFCETHNGVIPKDFIPQGCGNHKAITVNAR